METVPSAEALALMTEMLLPSAVTEKAEDDGRVVESARSKRSVIRSPLTSDAVRTGFLGGAGVKEESWTLSDERAT